MSVVWKLQKVIEFTSRNSAGGYTSVNTVCNEKNWILWGYWPFLLLQLNPYLVTPVYLKEIKDQYTYCENSGDIFWPNLMMVLNKTFYKYPSQKSIGTIFGNSSCKWLRISLARQYYAN